MRYDENWNDFRKIRALRRAIKDNRTSEEVRKILLQLRIEERRLTYKYDFKAFVLEVLRAETRGEHPSKLGKVHYNLCRKIRRCKNLGRPLIVRVPRYHLKTQICTIYYRMWRAVTTPEICAVIVSGTMELSKDTCRAIKHELATNAVMRQLWPNVLPPWITDPKKNKWSETEFNVAREGNPAQCSIEGYGVNATVTGKHFSEVSFDDVVTQENSNTAEQCEKVIKAYKFFLSIGNPQKRKGVIPIMIVGTNYTDNDLYSFLEQSDIKREYDEFVQPVFYDKEHLKPIWPEFYTLESLNRIRIQQGPYIWSSQYLLDPVPEDQQEFKTVWLRYYDSLPKDAHGNDITLTKEIFVDPITAKKTTSTSKDRGVVLTAGWDQRRNIYIIDYDLYPRAKESEMFDGILRQHEKHGVSVVRWECVAYQTQGKYNLEERLQRDQVSGLVVKEMTPGHKDKDSRIRTTIPHFEQGQIFFKPWMVELAKEYKRFPMGQTRDIMDLLAYVVIRVMGKKKKRNPFAGQIPPQKAWYM